MIVGAKSLVFEIELVEAALAEIHHERLLSGLRVDIKVVQVSCVRKYAFHGCVLEYAIQSVNPEIYLLMPLRRGVILISSFDEAHKSSTGWRGSSSLLVFFDIGFE